MLVLGSVSPIKHGDLPVSHVSFRGVILYFVSRCEFGPPLNPSQVFESFHAYSLKVFGRLFRKQSIIYIYIYCLSIFAPGSKYMCIPFLRNIVFI